MDLLYLTFSLLAVFITAETKGDSNALIPIRSSRKYGIAYNPQSTYGDDDDDMTDTDEDSSPSSSSSPTDGKPPVYPNLKGYDYGNNYYKGYPYAPYWKGSSKAKGANGLYDDFDIPPFMSPVKMMEMMMMMEAMGKLQQSSKPKDLGFLSKLVSDPKSALVAAIVPLSILLAAVAPVLVNYMMTGMSLPLVSTTASNKNGRGIEESSVLDEILVNFQDIARNVDLESCTQKTLCQIASRNTTNMVTKYIRKAAENISHLVREEWIKNLGVKGLVHGLKEGKCDNICADVTLTPRKEKTQL